MMTTNYEKYFGTPEKAAETLEEMDRALLCCPVYATTERPNGCTGCDYQDGYSCALDVIEWLQEECI